MTLLLPGTVLYLFLVIVPLLLALRFSFFQWSGVGPRIFVGLRNFNELLYDTTFWLAFRNNLLIIAFCVIGQLGIPLALSSIFASRLLVFRQFHRATIFIPVVMSSIVVGFLWRIMYGGDSGIIDLVLRAVGLGNIVPLWLDDPRIVVLSVSLPLVWQSIGFYTVIFMSAIASIPREIIEVAELDGATGVRKAVRITIPLIADTLRVAAMLCVAGNMKVFDNIFVMTGGGPGNSSLVLAQYAYYHAFVTFRLGYASSVALGMVILSLAMVLVISAVRRRDATGKAS